MKWLFENYEALGRVVLNLEPGSLTMITGPNGQGKSCIVRAMESFVKNKAGDKFIRSGKKSCKVGLADDDVKVFWERSATTAKYKIGNKVEKGLNRASLPEIYPDAGFTVEKELGEILVPFIVHEKTRIFPFNITPASVFKIFNRFLGAPALEKMVKDLKEQMKENRRELNRAEGNVETYDQELVKARITLSKMPDLDKMKAIQKAVNEKHSEWMRLRTLRALISSTIESFKETKIEVVSLTEFTSTLTPQVSEINNLVVDWEKARVVQAKLRDSKRRYDETKVEVVKLQERQSPDLEGLGGGLKKLQQLKSVKKVYNSYLVSKKEIVVTEEELLRAQKGLKEFQVCPTCERPFNDTKDMKSTPVSEGLLCR